MAHGLPRSYASCSFRCVQFLEGLNQAEFHEDKRTQSAVVMMEVVWDTVQTALPSLQLQLSELIKSAEQPSTSKK